MRHTILHRLLRLFSLAVLATPASAQTPSPSPAATDPVAQLLQASPQDLRENTGNQAFLDTPIDESLIDRLRTQVGRSAVENQLDLTSFQGQSVDQLLRSRPQAFERNPQLLLSLASSARAPVYPPGSSVAPIEVPSPGRTISAQDLQANLTGEGGSPERFRDFLRRDFELSDDQIAAYEAFITLMEEETPPDSSRGLGADQVARSLNGIDRLRESATGQEIPEGTGLYLPPADSLQRMEELVAFMRDFEGAADKNPETFRARDGRTLSELIGMMEPDPARQLPMDAVRNLTPEAMRGEIMRLMRGVAQRERNGPNRFLFEQGLAFLLNRDGSRIRELLERSRSRRLPSFCPIGNQRVAEMNQNFYRRLMLGESKRPDQRDLEELADPDEVFAVRGHPADMFDGRTGNPRKSYDPPTSGPEMFNGAGLNLDHTIP